MIPNYLGNMAAALQIDNISIQYCMPSPSHYMASTQYANVRTVRPSGDRFDANRWDSFLYDSRLATAVGLWPWADVFFSSELDNLVVATLSAGPVGVGDPLGQTNAKNLFSAIRADGVLLKPDKPLLPIDAMYVADAENRCPHGGAGGNRIGGCPRAFAFSPMLGRAPRRK
jgi:hypothetical protein